MKMVFIRTSIQILVISILVPEICAVNVTSLGPGVLTASIIVTVRRKRNEHWDFVQLNRNICPPSLCVAADSVTGQGPKRPRGTGGTVFFQGDIILDNTIDKFIYKDEETKRRRKRATMKMRKRLWEKGVVVYKMAKDISTKAERMFRRAMIHIEERTCIKFREKTYEDEDYIRFISEPGCWSQIGCVGGTQMVSLGQGCEVLGTAVHEIVHALGVWHEQARPDRDKYVKIREDNISTKFLPDFEVVDKKVSTSRGHPYDYLSLMHYDKHAFTRNGEPTIEVIGVGEKLGLKIGQRTGLSSIDISQLRDMYKCNLLIDKNETVCHDGWVKYMTTCYKFTNDTRQQFDPAFKSCQSQNSQLLIIENKREQRFINKYLNKEFQDVHQWRIGARVVNDYMVWYLGKASIRNITGYTNWAKDQPGSYTSAILERDKVTTEFKWSGTWIGSSKQRPAYEYAYICEKPARRKCVPGAFEDGRDYRGNLDHTQDGHSCLKWTDNYPHNHSLVQVSLQGAKSDEGENEDGLGDHSKCRNPSGIRRNRPWCFTAKKNVKWGYCDVSICAKSIREADEARKRKRKRNLDSFFSSSPSSEISSKEKRGSSARKTSSSLSPTTSGRKTSSSKNRLSSSSSLSSSSRRFSSSSSSRSQRRKNRNRTASTKSRPNKDRKTRLRHKPSDKA